MEKKVIGICSGRSCCQVNQALLQYAEDLERQDVVFEEAMCLGMCESAPNIRVDEEGERTKYPKVDVSYLENVCD